jgi:hypothetical protein
MMTIIEKLQCTGIGLLGIALLLLVMTVPPELRPPSTRLKAEAIQGAGNTALMENYSEGPRHIRFAAVAVLVCGVACLVAAHMVRSRERLSLSKALKTRDGANKALQATAESRADAASIGP